MPRNRSLRSILRPRASAPTRTGSPGANRAPTLIPEPGIVRFDTTGNDALAWAHRLAGVAALAGAAFTLVRGPVLLVVPFGLVALIALVRAAYRRRGRVELEDDGEAWIVRRAVGRWSRRSCLPHARLRAVTATRRRVTVRLAEPAGRVRFGFGLDPDAIATIAALLSAMPAGVDPPVVRRTLRQQRRHAAVFHVVWVAILGCGLVIVGLAERSFAMSTFVAVVTMFFEVLLGLSAFGTIALARRDDRWTVELALGSWGYVQRFWRTELRGVELTHETALTSWAPSQSWYASVELHHASGITVGRGMGLPREQAEELQRLLLDRGDVPG